MRLPARCPARMQRRNDSPEVSRAAAGNTRGPQLRRRACRGPCDGATRGSRGPRGYASAGGNRAPCDGGGCSADRYACSQHFSVGPGPQGPSAWSAAPRRAKPELARSRLGGVREHGSTRRQRQVTGQRYARLFHRVKPSRPLDHLPPAPPSPRGLDEAAVRAPDLWMTSCRWPLRGVRFGADEIPRRPPSHPECAVPSVRHGCRAFPPTTALTCTDVLGTGPRSGLRAMGSHGSSRSFTGCGEGCGVRRARSRRRDPREQ